MIYSGTVMIKKDSYTWKIYGLVVVVLCIVPAFLHAQEKDFTTWASAGFKYKVKPAFTLSGKLEWRTKDDLGKTDRWGLDVGGAYSVLPFLKVAAGYEIHYRNRGEAGWKFRHRYHFDGTLSTRVQRLKVSLRERFQHTFDSSGFAAAVADAGNNFNILSTAVAMSFVGVRVLNWRMIFRNAR